MVVIDELITMVRVALDESPVTVCPAGDLSGDGHITTDEIIAAVNAALFGCPYTGMVDPIVTRTR